MDSFDFDFDFPDCVRAVVAALFLLGSVELHAAVADQADEPTDRPPHAEHNIPGQAPRYDSDAPASSDERAARMLNERDRKKVEERAQKGDRTLQRADKLTRESQPTSEQDKAKNP